MTGKGLVCNRVLRIFDGDKVDTLVGSLTEGALNGLQFVSHAQTDEDL